jgi:hypothetical protein
LFFVLPGGGDSGIWLAIGFYSWTAGVVGLRRSAKTTTIVIIMTPKTTASIAAIVRQKFAGVIWYVVILTLLFQGAKCEKNFIWAPFLLSVLKLCFRRKIPDAFVPDAFCISGSEKSGSKILQKNGRFEKFHVKFRFKFKSRFRDFRSDWGPVRLV